MQVFKEAQGTLVPWASRSPKDQLLMSLHKELKAQAIYCPPLRAEGLTLFVWPILVTCNLLR